MTLTIGRSPFGPQPGVFNFERSGPDHVLYFEDSPRRVRALFNGETVADSRRVKLLHETGLLPVYYFPEEHMRRELLEASDLETGCPFKGSARYHSIRVGDRVANNAVWYYPEPIPGAPPLAGYCAIVWDAMDEWYEEDRQQFVHARDPYHRIDVLPTSRHVKISIDGQVVADSRRALALFESSLPTRYYILPDDVRQERLEPSEATTRCAYKGLANYHSVRVGDKLHVDVAWSYRDPAAEVATVADRLCFFDEKVDVDLDGERQKRPKTGWS